jgi:hypothetical protein
MMLPQLSMGASRTPSATRVPRPAHAPQFFGKLFRKAGKAVRPVARKPLRLAFEGAHNQYGDLPATALPAIAGFLLWRQRPLFVPGLEGSPVGTAGDYAGIGDEYPCGTCADGKVMWCDLEGNSSGCWS